MPQHADILFGFDVGRKKTGLAIGNQITGGARPLAILYGELDKQLDAAAAYVDKWGPQGMVVGLPTHMDGTTHAMTKISRRFADRLKERFLLPVQFADERLSSAVANQRPDVPTDSTAAAIILQAWLDSCNSKTPL